MTTGAGETVNFGIPGTGKATVEDGSVTYESPRKSTGIVVQPTTDGVRALITIEDASAPTTFKFPVDVPNGGALGMTPDGGVSVLNEEGMQVASVAPPWATDANGKDVPTRFEIVNGDEIVQHVEHTEAFAYPIKADPAWLIPIAVWAVRQIIVNALTKNLLRSRGYYCSPWGPWLFACYGRAS